MVKELLLKYETLIDFFFSLLSYFIISIFHLNDENCKLTNDESDLKQLRDAIWTSKSIIFLLWRDVCK